MNSPFFVLFDKHPSLQDLKIFGRALYPYLRHYNSSKFQPRTSVCIFLGYASRYKRALCYNLQSKKLILSRHVVHDESLFPAKSINGAGITQAQQFVTSALVVVQLQIPTTGYRVDNTNEIFVTHGL